VASIWATEAPEAGVREEAVSEVHIRSIEINDLFGTKHAAFKPKTITRISGANGTGKSSILRAIVSLFEGGHDPSQIRKGAKRGQITMTLTNDAVIQKIVTPSSSRYEITDEKGLPVSAPASFIKRLGESWAVDPGKLLAIDASTKPGRKQLVDQLAQLMPLSFTQKDLLEHVERGTEHGAAEKADEIARLIFPSTAEITLDELKKLRKQVEEARRAVGRQVKEAEETANSLRRSLSEAEDEDTDWAQQAVDLESGRLALQREEAQRIQELQAEYQKNLRTIEADKQRALAQIREDYGPEHQQASAALVTARERAATQERLKGARQTADTMRNRALEKTHEYDAYSRVLAATDSLKKERLDDLPIPGLDVSEDSVLIDNVEWNNVNKARVSEVVLQICALQAGALPFLVFDDAEHLDGG
jgi:hypothetical protein